MHASVLRYIIEVARHGSVRKAGAALDVASSGINQRILSLENELGVSLFARSPRGMEPTSTGRLLLEHAERTLNDYANIRSFITDARNLISGHVRFACEGAVHEQFFGKIFGHFSASHPKVTLSAFQLSAAAVIQSLEDCHVEIGVSYTQFARQSTRCLSDVSAPFGAVVAPTHRVATRSSISLGECLDHSLVRFCEPGSRDMMLDEHLERESSKFRVFCHTNSLASTRAAIQSGAAISISSKFAFAEDIAAGDLIFVPIVHPVLSTFRLGLFTRSNRHIDTIERQFGNMVMTALASHTTPQHVTGP